MEDNGNFDKSDYRKACWFFFEKYVTYENLKLELYKKWELDFSGQKNEIAIKYLLDIYSFQKDILGVVIVEIPESWQNIKNVL